MSDLTPERLAELRRIAEAATPGPWTWRMSKDGRILDLITLETGYNEEIITPSHINAWLQVKGGLKDYIPVFDPTTVLELLDALAAARAEAELWKQQYEKLRAAVIRAEADYASRADGLDDTLMILRQLLAEAGGGVDERV